MNDIDHSNHPTKAPSNDYIRQHKDERYLTLSRTEFEHYRQQFMIGLYNIRDMRLVEHLGRYRSRAQKQSRFDAFKKQYDKLKEHKELLEKEARLFKHLIGKTNSSIINRSSIYESDLPFSTKITAQIKDMELTWSTLFQEGSLRRLISVLSMLRINDQDIVIEPEISEWSLRMLQYFELGMPPKKSSCFGCCMG